VAATRSIASRARSRLLTLSFDISQLAGPEELGNCGRIRWVSGRPDEAPGYAGTDFIIAQDGRISAVYLFSTSYRELDSTVPENWREEIPTGPRWRLPGRWSATCLLWSAGIRTSCLPRSSAERRQLKTLSNKERAKTSGFIDAQTARSCSCRLGEGANSGGSLRIVSGLAENTNSIICDGSSESETANGCPVLHGQ